MLVNLKRKLRVDLLFILKTEYLKRSNPKMERKIISFSLELTIKEKGKKNVKRIFIGFFEPFWVVFRLLPLTKILLFPRISEAFDLFRFHSITLIMSLFFISTSNVDSI